MANKYHTQLRNKESAKIFKIVDPMGDRNKASKELFKKAKGLRKGIAKGLKEHRASESYKMHKKTMQKIPHDLTYMKGYLKGK